jgi:hypothetical protein
MEDGAEPIYSRAAWEAGLADADRDDSGWCTKRPRA